MKPLAHLRTDLKVVQGIDNDINVIRSLRQDQLAVLLLPKCRKFPKEEFFRLYIARAPAYRADEQVTNSDVDQS